MANVSIEKVAKVYPGDVRAVDSISLAINDKEFIVLVGPSGCGKSTTLRMVAGLEEITEGVIKIGDRVVNDVAPKDRDIAMVFQNYALYPHMTVFNNMAFGLKLRKTPKTEIQERVMRAAEILGIEPLLERKPKALSGGQRQRVAVGRAIVRDPACFLFDEPLSNLDAKLRVETRAELKRLHHRLQTTTIYVTHDQEEAMTLGDRVVVMSNGLIQQAASPLTVYNTPANRFVAAFVGTPPMNFLDGKLTVDPISGGVNFECEGVKIALADEKADLVRERAQSNTPEVVFGYRPEGMYLRPSEEANREDQSLDVIAQVVEPLGSTMDVYCDTAGGDRLTARIKAEPMEDEQKVKLYVDISKTHIFLPGEHGLNITLDPAAQPATVGV